MAKDDLIDDDRVRAALRRTIASEQFSQTPQLVGFLTYVVEKTLAGASDEIKAYTIAVDALGKPEDFDPQNNASVRVMAGRLRRALELHNHGLGPDDVRIVLSKGSYVPEFREGSEGEIEVSEEPEGRAPDFAGALANADVSVGDRARAAFTESRDHRPARVHAGGQFRDARRLGLGVVAGLVLTAASVFFASWFLLREEKANAREMEVDDTRLPSISASILAPAAEYPPWFSNAQFAEDVDTVVSRFDDYTFLRTGLYHERNAKGLAPLAGPEGLGDYHISVSTYPFRDRMRVFVRIIRTNDEATIWSRRYLVSEPSDTNPALLDLLGLNFSPLGSPYGVIYADLLRSQPPRPELRCILTAYRYFAREDDALRVRTRTCTEALIEEGTRLPSIHAIHAILMAEGRRGSPESEQRDLDAARLSALHAIEFGPQSARAHQALYVVRRAQKLYGPAEESVKTAYALNPYDTTVVSSLASWLVARGKANEAKRFLERIVPRGTIHDTRFGMVRVLAADLAGDDREAIRIARTLDPALSADAALGAIIGAGLGNDRARAAAAYAALERHSPALANDPFETLEKQDFVPIVAAHVARMVRDARAEAVETSSTRQLNVALAPL